MAYKIKPNVFDKDSSLDEIQTHIRNREAMGRTLKSIDLAHVVLSPGSQIALCTIAHFVSVDVAPTEIFIQADTDAGTPAPSGKVLVCRGRAIIAGTETKIVAFRNT